MDFNSMGLLILRLGIAGTMAIAHGLPKLLSFTSKMHSFPDPIGLGSVISLSLTVGAEFLCAILLVFGFFTRLASLPLVITMAVAFFVIHKADPFGTKELAFLYLAGFSTLFCCGAGRFSVDAIFRGVK